MFFTILYVQLTEEIFRRCIKNEGTKIAKQIQEFLDVQVVYAILSWGWITSDEFMHRLELSQIFVRNNVNSQAKSKFLSENWKLCNHYYPLWPNEGKMGTKYIMRSFCSSKLTIIQRNWVSDCASAYFDYKMIFYKMILLTFYLPYISHMKTWWTFSPSICISVP